MSKISAPTPKEIPPCPQAGTGVHTWMMEAAWACRINGMTAEETARELHSRIPRRPTPANEIETAVAKVFDRQIIIGDRSRQWSCPPKWPDKNSEQIEAVTASGLGVVDLWEASPIRFDSAEPQTAGILRRMFPGDPWLCTGATAYDFSTRRLSEIEHPETIAQIVPSPMLAKHGRRKVDGELSEHTLEATGPRRFFVIEGDGTGKDTQAAVLLHLAKKAPLTLVCDSGGKSLHGFFFCAGKSDAQLAPFFRKACTLGADRALWTRSQFARMPDGTRANGNRQAVYFWNPATLKD